MTNNALTAATLTDTQNAWLAANDLAFKDGHNGDFEILPVDAPAWYTGEEYDYVARFRINRHVVKYVVLRSYMTSSFGMDAPAARQVSEHKTLKAALKALVAAR